MRILVVGSGGREHALAWSIAGSPLTTAVLAAPGNAGIAEVATCFDVAAEDVEGLVALAKREAVELVLVGPEAPLVAGLVDRLESEGIKAFGPSAAAARLEGSKAYMKEVCEAAGVPTAAYATFSEAGPAKAWVREQGAPIVVKADGLAAGKGVVVAATVEEAEAAIDRMLGERVFGEAGALLVVEECLEGAEASFFALSDGRTVLPLAGAQDHKRIGEGDTGPNTGGMGAFSPTPRIDEAMAERVMAEIVEPVTAELARRGSPYKGLLYAGLMIGPEGPKVLEFNVRFGDPECQVLMMRLMSDLVPALFATVDGQLASLDLRWYPEPALTVVMAAKGYPGSYAKGEPIGGLSEAQALDEGIEIFHAGTRRDDQGRLVSNGGRVLGVSATARSLAEARQIAYAAIEKIDWPGATYRRDIAEGVE